MRCDAKIRPMRPVNEVELQCEINAEHPCTTHEAIIKDYAYPGSQTVLAWYEDDRRNFRGEWAPCHLLDGTHNLCTLPAAHHGACAP